MSIENIPFIFFVITWGMGILFLRLYRIWFFHYLLGTTGLAFILVYINRNLFHSEIYLAQSVAKSVHILGNLINIPTQIFPQAPGLLLVLVIVQKIGWTALEIGVESSGLLEMCVLTALILFYPGWNWFSRILRIFIGLLFTWLANTARMTIIMLMLHYLGKDVLVLAHTFLGKLFFFICTIAIYWYLVTKPSLRMIEKNILALRTDLSSQ